MTPLVRLVFSMGSGLSSKGVDCLRSLTALRCIDLSGCWKVAQIGHLEGLSSLTILSITYCSEMADKDLSLLGSFAAFKPVDLLCCKKITDAGVGHLVKLTSLYELVLYECSEVTDKGVSHLGH